MKNALGEKQWLALRNAFARGIQDRPTRVTNVDASSPSSKSRASRIGSAQAASARSEQARNARQVEDHNALVQMQRDLGKVASALNMDDPTAAPEYRELWSAAGRPRTWPLPRPTYVGRDIGHRYAYTQASTGNLVFTIAAGTRAFIAVQPYANEMVIRVWNDATCVVPTSWGAQYQMDDRIDSFLDSVGWALSNPFDAYGDPARLKTSRFNVLPAAGDYQSLSQLLAGHLSVQVMGPFDAIGGVYYANTGTCPDRVGSKQPFHSFDALPGVPFVHGLQQAFVGGVHQARVAGSAAASAAQVVNSVYKTELMTGMGGPLHVELPYEGDRCWFYSGELDTVDAPSAGFVSSANNFYPRSNIQNHVARGGVMVVNTGAVALTVSCRFSATHAHILKIDGADNSVPNLASLIRESAQQLRATPAAADAHAYQLPVLATRIGGKSVADHVRDHLKSIGVPASKAAKVARDQPDHATTTQAMLGGLAQGAAVAAAAQSGILGKVGSFFKGALGFAEKEIAQVPRIAARSLPYVEEVL